MSAGPLKKYFFLAKINGKISQKDYEVLNSVIDPCVVVTCTLLADADSLICGNSIIPF